MAMEGVVTKRVLAKVDVSEGLEGKEFNSRLEYVVRSMVGKRLDEVMEKRNKEKEEAEKSKKPVKPAALVKLQEEAAEPVVKAVVEVVMEVGLLQAKDKDGQARLRSRVQALHKVVLEEMVQEAEAKAEKARARKLAREKEKEAAQAGASASGGGGGGASKAEVPRAAPSTSSSSAPEGKVANPESLSVKELKQLLQKHGIDSSQCIEKDDLVALARKHSLCS